MNVSSSYSVNSLGRTMQSGLVAQKRFFSAAELALITGRAVCALCNSKRETVCPSPIFGQAARDGRRGAAAWTRLVNQPW